MTLLFVGAVAHGVTNAEAIAKQSCNTLTARVDAVAGNAPLFLRSYDHERGDGEPDEPALRTAAFTYDNALAVIALLACDKPAQAVRVGEALRLAAMNDARLRNTYRAVAVENGKPLPNGWWDAKQNRWVEDAYQMSSATGNVAWAGLALTALYEASGDTRRRDAAERLSDFIIPNVLGRERCVRGGIYGFDANSRRVDWCSTEHNVDVDALTTRLMHARASRNLRGYADARRFIESMWDPASGHFFIGTLPNGEINHDVSGLDAQLWPLLLPGARKEWRRALAWTEREHGVPGGFDFNNDRDGLWLEGTAQAALVYRLARRETDAQRLLQTIATQFAPGGFVYATREPRITTGLAVGGDSTSADFYYYRRPHLAATAWAALAALDRNPFEPAPEKAAKQR